MYLYLSDYNHHGLMVWTMANGDVCVGKGTHSEYPYYKYPLDEVYYQKPKEFTAHEKNIIKGILRAVSLEKAANGPTRYMSGFNVNKEIRMRVREGVERELRNHQG